MSVAMAEAPAAAGKVCVACGRWRPHRLFYAASRRGRGDGYRNTCIACMLLRDSERRAGEAPVPSQTVLQRLEQLIGLGQETGRRYDALAAAVIVLARYDAEHHHWAKEAGADEARRWLRDVGIHWIAQLEGLAPDTSARVTIVRHETEGAQGS